MRRGGERDAESAPEDSELLSYPILAPCPQQWGAITGCQLSTPKILLVSGSSHVHSGARSQDELSTDPARLSGLEPQLWGCTGHDR